MSVNLRVNGKPVTVDAEAEMPLLWVLREKLGLNGTKFGCGIGQCGACIVHMNGQPIPSCQVRLSDAEGQEVTTIEGLSVDGSHPLQKAWVDLNVPQCGYCQSGMIMKAAALLKVKEKPTVTDINNFLTNICRCGTYIRIRKAILQAAQS